MERKSFVGMHCSVAQCLEVVGEWWSMLIVRSSRRPPDARDPQGMRTSVGRHPDLLFLRGADGAEGRARCPRAGCRRASDRRGATMTAETPMLEQGIFSAVSAVTELAPGRFSAEIDPEWTIGAKPNGGYLLSMLARAGTSTSMHDHVVA